MLFYFPQWQGSGTGKPMARGAFELINYLNRPYTEVPLSTKALHTAKNINAYEALLEQLSGFKSILKQHRPLDLQIVGGDCGLEIVPVSYLGSIYPNLGVIWFDAHADFNVPEESPSQNFHGMPLRTLIGEGDAQFQSLLFQKIDPQQIHYLGLRSVDKSEQRQINKYQVFAHFKPEVGALVETLRSKGCEHLYIHFDVDCLDPKVFNHSYYKVHNGLSIEDSISYLNALYSNFRVVGSSLLETVVTKKQELYPIKEIIKQLFN